MKPNHIRAVICAFRDGLPEMFPDCTQVPKTIIFSQDADDILKVVRKEFSEGVDFCKKVATKDPKTKAILSDFFHSFNPRVIVIVE